ncbi:DNA glycosylase AlkZ-like family protein [Chitinophaga sedimenti]|uniref:DNA glycosylase AlkZ-like family protein n=1 Tax=Chitinophaga sedimenti TaxID=2033606 RepID=UPI0027E101D4|nr:crosslink repair DNA glycosylase YcaQ family protein [Chitinophaga sedimenti]
MNVKNNASLLRMRLHGQLISQTPLHSAGDVVHTMLAIQAQDYAGAKWSIGLRLPGATDETIENAIAEKQIVRSWVLRNTLHFVSPKDLRWMLTLLKDRLLHAATQNAARNGGVDEKCYGALITLSSRRSKAEIFLHAKSSRMCCFRKNCPLPKTA